MNEEPSKFSHKTFPYKGEQERYFVVTGGIMGKTALLDAFLQSDLDCKGFKLLNADLSGIVDIGLDMPEQFQVDGSPIKGTGTFEVQWSGLPIPTSIGGVPAGGLTGQALLKASDTDFDTLWGAGGGGGGTGGDGGGGGTVSVTTPPPKNVMLSGGGTGGVGSGTYTPSAGCVALYVECWGGGGGGAFAPAVDAAHAAAGGGGGGGAYAASYFSSVKASYAFSIGAGGTGPVGAAATKGGDTWFDSATILKAAGGGAGWPAAGGSGQDASTQTGWADGGLPDQCVGQIILGGGVGGPGVDYIFGGGIVCHSGEGGDAPLSSGGGMNVLDFGQNDGFSYGGGGSGGTSAPDNTETRAAQRGGNGFQGAVRITEYFSTGTGTSTGGGGGGGGTGGGSVPIDEQPTGIKDFTHAGAGTYTPSAGAIAIYVECIGGGGGGGGAQGGTGISSAGGGGAGGSYATKYIAGPLEASYPYVIGAAGTRGPNVSNMGGGGPSNGYGGNGGDTTFGTVVVAKGGGGGSGGVQRGGGFAIPSGYPGVGQVGSVGDLISEGQDGAWGMIWTTTAAQGGIGGAPGGLVNDVSSNTSYGEQQGPDATGYGSGGGGANSHSGNGWLGGLGGHGYMRITEYFAVQGSFNVVGGGGGGGGGTAAAPTKVVHLTQTGAQTYTPSAGCLALYVECVGGGGGGAGALGSATTCACAGGGAGGAYAASYITNPAASYPYVVGGGGAGGVGLAAGTVGGNTNFGSGLVIGAGGDFAKLPWASPETFPTYSGGPGVGATDGSVGDFLCAGSSGGYGVAESNRVGISGSGGASHFGGSVNGTLAWQNGFNGWEGDQYGGGGSGATSAWATAQNGGAGFQGVIRITEYFGGGVGGGGTGGGGGGTVTLPVPAVTKYLPAGTYTVPDGVKGLFFIAIGGGGGGGGAHPNLANLCSTGGGAGGGACCASYVYEAQLAASYEITIGAGGIGGTAAGTYGTKGGDTSVSGVISAGGGNPGGGSTTGANFPGINGSGGFGGNPVTAGNVANIQGGDGEDGIIQAATSGFGGSGASGGGFLGGGNSVGGWNSNGSLGKNYGGGGAGASAFDVNGRAGGNGSAGAVIVTEYYGGDVAFTGGGGGSGGVQVQGTPAAPQLAEFVDANTIKGTETPTIVGIGNLGNIGVGGGEGGVTQSNQAGGVYVQPAGTLSSGANAGFNYTPVNPLATTLLNQWVISGAGQVNLTARSSGRFLVFMSADLKHSAANANAMATICVGPLPFPPAGAAIDAGSAYPNWHAVGLWQPHTLQIPGAPDGLSQIYMLGGQVAGGLAVQAPLPLGSTWGAAVCAWNANAGTLTLVDHNIMFMEI